MHNRLCTKMFDTRASTTALIHQQRIINKQKKMPHISIFAFFRRPATSVSSFRFYFASQQKYEIKKNKHIRFFVVYPEAHCVSDAIICTYIQIIRSNARHKTAETSGASERRMAILSKETLFIFYYSPFQPFLCAIFSVPFFLLLSLPGISASQFRLCGGAGERANK